MPNSLAAQRLDPPLATSKPTRATLAGSLSPGTPKHSPSSRVSGSFNLRPRSELDQKFTRVCYEPKPARAFNSALYQMDEDDIQMFDDCWKPRDVDLRRQELALSDDAAEERGRKSCLSDFELSEICRGGGYNGEVPQEVDDSNSYEYNSGAGRFRRRTFANLSNRGFYGNSSVAGSPNRSVLESVDDDCAAEGCGSQIAEEFNDDDEPYVHSSLTNALDSLEIQDRHNSDTAAPVPQTYVNSIRPSTDKQEHILEATTHPELLIRPSNKPGFYSDGESSTTTTWAIPRSLPENVSTIGADPRYPAIKALRAAMRNIEAAIHLTEGGHTGTQDAIAEAQLSRGRLLATETQYKILRQRIRVLELEAHFWQEHVAEQRKDFRVQKDQLLGYEKAWNEMYVAFRQVSTKLGPVAKRSGALDEVFTRSRI